MQSINDFLLDRAVAPSRGSADRWGESFLSGRREKKGDEANSEGDTTDETGWDEKSEFRARSDRPPGVRGSR